MKPQPDALRAISDNQFAGLRLLLGITVLAVHTVAPLDDDESFDVSHVLLLGYAVYNLVAFQISRRRQVFARSVQLLMICLDISLYILLTFFNGAGSPTFPFLFLAVVTAYTQLGVSAGAAVTLAGVSSFLTLAYFGKTNADSNHLILRSTSLLALATALSYWARAEQILRRRLDLLRDLSLVSNPRFGMNRMTSHVMERVLEFFHADTCVLIGYVGASNDYVLRVATNNQNAKSESEPIESPEHLRDLLQEVLHSRVGLYTSRSFLHKEPASVSWNPTRPDILIDMPQAVALSVAEWLRSRSFIAVPLRHHEWVRGYCLIGSARPSAFGMGDARFLLQVADQVTPVFEHIRIMDRMASDAAEEERRRVGRSIHDRVIQPYIGLQIGLHGFRRILKSAVTEQDANAVPLHAAITSVDYLVRQASEGLEDLRDCVYGLRSETQSRNPLLDSLRRYADKFTALTGIQVSVSSELDKSALTDRLAAEIFQIATETLNGVHRHTTATSVELKIEKAADGNVAVRTTDNSSENDGACNSIPEPPVLHEQRKSFAEYLPNGMNVHTIVNLKIPL